MSGSLIVFAALALAAGSPEAAASSAGASEAGASSEPAAKPAKPICRSEETTATRLGKRKVCKTREAWKLQDQQSDRTARDLGHSPSR